ncbi:hypothetical protein [Pelagibius marinus]|uniref:hypothetical protein n=1 Tax=Pelagibius marinus TaxID=2762760 RepID=UPI001872C870|nr:hypothetical protein [Pelagibius marinus]
MTYTAARFGRMMAFFVLDLASLLLTGGNFDALFGDVRPRRDILLIGDGGSRIVFGYPDALGAAAGRARFG